MVKTKQEKQQELVARRNAGMQRCKEYFEPYRTELIEEFGEEKYEAAINLYLQPPDLWELLNWVKERT